MEKKRTKFEDQVIRRRKRKVLLGVFVLVVFLGLSYLFVWERVYTLRLAEENAQTHQRVRDLKEKSRSLEYEINQLCSVRRIEDIARRDLALIPPREIQFAAYTVSSGNKELTDSKIVKPAASNKSTADIKPSASDKPTTITKPQKSSKDQKANKRQNVAKPKTKTKSPTPKLKVPKTK
jgi:cell division protein FtsL